MSIIELNINQDTKPQSLASALKQQNLQRGDRLDIRSLLDEEMSLLIVLVALAVYNKMKIDYADKLLKDIFGNMSSMEIQKEIEKEYGIAVQKETAKEKENWQQFSKQQFAKAYGIDEEEYSPNMIKEPNPDYKK
ncbi:MAG TPA: hypothetical protein VK787_12535 [Puia sp.]|jgi:hypothetical protein|nr:hypothetical protein [Puia sp.]